MAYNVGLDNSILLKILGKKRHCEKQREENCKADTYGITAGTTAACLPWSYYFEQGIMSEEVSIIRN